MKICSKCKQEKEFIFFSKRKSRKIGIQPQCKECDLKRFNEWKKNNIERRKMWRNNNEKKLRILNIEYKLRGLISTVVGKHVKNGKDFPTWTKLPYTPSELKKHLESQFENWMNWDNYGRHSLNKITWQIDHIIPQSKLIYDSLEHSNFEKCWSLNNLRPLKSETNNKKKDKIL